MALAAPCRELHLEQASFPKPRLSYPSPGFHAEWTFLPLPPFSRPPFSSYTGTGIPKMGFSFLVYFRPRLFFEHRIRVWDNAEIQNAKHSAITRQVLITWFLFLLVTRPLHDLLTNVTQLFHH